MAQQNPKKPKPKKLNLNNKTAWRDIIKQVDKKEVPIQVLEKLNVNLKDGTIVVVDIKKLLEHRNRVVLLDPTGQCNFATEQS